MKAKLSTGKPWYKSSTTSYHWTKYLVFGAIAFLMAATGRNKYREVPIISEVSFREGEKMTYYVAYGLIKAGEAELTINPSKKIPGQFHIVGTGNSYSFFDVFFKVRDRYETYFDPNKKVPTEFVRDINEGGYSKQQHYVFDHASKTVFDIKKQREYSMDHERTQDILSAFYYARLLDTRNLQVGDRLYIPTFLDEEMFRFFLEFKGREVLSTKHGKIRTLKFTPVVQKGRVFNDEETMTIWVTDDQNRMPILLKSKLRVGAVRLELKEFANLKTPPKFY
ncbi:MAG: DUF3108 domain-containing protein [Flavobacteriales bacterium]|nr:MAG: DUF3108 domain-containing protein [Flavobacteriales bacterium]